MALDHLDAPEREERLDEAITSFLEATELGPQPDRQAWLDRYPDLAAELAEFFTDQERVDRLAAPLRAVIQTGAATPLSPGGSAPGHRAEDEEANQPFDLFQTADAPSTPGFRVFGDFRILREVGRGGMGVVYEAEQISLNRRVALKVLPFAATMDPRQLQRFQNEARAAASLEHPHIVPVYGVGCERGVHYYAMKFIDGQSLAQVVDELRKAKETNHRATENTEKNQDTAASSLCSLCLCGSKDFFKSIAELGIQAALALEHAHSLGIIHRDIKPANLLIENSSLIVYSTPGANATRLAASDSSLITHHSSLRLWITDFGLARTAADAGLTMTGDMLGTLRYMSPEQALAKHGLVDHRTDIYSLGATLYELLTLERAYGANDRQELLQQIAFEEPKPPRRINKSIPQDMEIIVLKAMEKNPADRYATAQELADDLRQYLDHKTIQARRPTWRQVFAKWVRRHPGVTKTAATFSVLLLVAAVVSTWQAVRATNEADRASRAEKAAEEELDKTLAEKERADKEAAIAKAVNEFLQELLGQSDISKQQMAAGERNRNITVRELLDRAAKDIDTKFKDQELTEAAIRHTLGNSYVALSEHPEAQKHLERSLAIRRQTLGADHPDTLQSMDSLAHSYAQLGRHADALKLCEESLMLRKAKLGPEHPDTLTSMVHLGLIYSYLGRHAEAVKLYEETLPVMKTKIPDHAFTFNCMHNLALSYQALGRYADALKLHEETLALWKAKLGPDHSDTLASMNNLATVYQDLGRHADALRLHEETLALRKAKLGPDHSDTLASMNNLAHVYQALGRHADALKLHEETLALQKAKLGPEHPDTLASVNNLANLYRALGRHADALKLHEETLALRKAKLGPDHPHTLASMHDLATVYQALGRHAEAVKLYEETLLVMKAKIPDHAFTFNCMHNLANSYRALGRHADALKLHEETLALRKAKLGPEHPDTLASMNILAIGYAQLGRHAEALKLNEETLALRKAKLGPDHPDTLGSMVNLGVIYSYLGRHAEAAKLYEETLPVVKTKIPDHAFTFNCMHNLALSYQALGRHADALKLYEETLALRKAKLGPDHPDTLASMVNLAASYARLGRHADALKLREETLALQKVKLGPDHPDMLLSMGNLAVSLVQLDRGPEAVPMIDECVQRAAGKVVHPNLIAMVMDSRLRHFEKTKDAAGCRTTAEMWEKLNRADGNSLYDAACMRAVTAAVIRATDLKSGPQVKQANAEADRAMVWLKRAVAAGYKNAVHLKQDADLNDLRDREDFKKLMTQLEEEKMKTAPQPPPKEIKEEQPQSKK